MREKFFMLSVVAFALISISFPLHTASPKEKSTKEDSAQGSKEVEYYIKGRESYLLFTPSGFQEAIKYYNKSIEVNPKFAPPYAGLGEVYSFTGFYKFEVREEYEADFNTSYKNIAKALKLDPNGKETQRALALSYLHLRRYKEAEAAARRVLAQDPNDAESYYIIWASTGRDPNNPNIKKALELDPNLVIAHVGLAQAYFYKKGDYNKSTEHYKKAVELADSPQLHKYLGTSLRTQGYLGQALSEYQRAIELDPDDASAYTDLGITLLYMNKIEESIASQKKAISLNPNYPDAYYYLAIAYEKANNKPEAIKNYQAFINLTTGHVRYANYIASARESLVKLNGK
jgi:tetratricopeptide (TPR) repeat protein